MSACPSCGAQGCEWCPQIVHVGQRLGSENRVASMQYFKTWGWVAKDITGAEYAQVMPRGADPFRRVILHDGLGGLRWPEPPL